MSEIEEKIPPLHPGEVLLKKFLTPMGISAYRLAKEINVPLTRIRAIVQGRRSISADTALRLSRYFGTTAKLWMNLQAAYDLDVEEDRLGERLIVEIKPFAAVDVVA